jgi:hypothetical protein
MRFWWLPSSALRTKCLNKLDAETLALHKKTNSLRGVAGLKRILLLKEVAKQKVCHTVPQNPF